MKEIEKYKAVVSDRAKNLWGDQVRFLTKHTKKAAAAKKAEIMTAMHSLTRMPQRFPFFDGIHITPNKYRKMFIKNRYLVLYQIHNDTVYVDYILDCRKDYDRQIN